MKKTLYLLVRIPNTRKEGRRWDLFMNVQNLNLFSFQGMHKTLTLNPSLFQPSRIHMFVKCGVYEEEESLLDNYNSKHKGRKWDLGIFCKDFW